MKKEFLKHINLIRKMAWGFVQAHPGLEFDDMFGEACLICLQQMHKYDPDRGAISTFIFHVVQSHFSSLFSKTKHKQHELLEEATITTPSPEETIIRQETFKDFFLDLSPEALEMAKIAMEIGDYEDVPKKIRGKAVKELRQRDWPWSRIWQTNNELKLAVRQL